MTKKNHKLKSLHHITQELIEVQRICSDHHYPIYERFEAGWLDPPRFVVEQILDEIDRKLIEQILDEIDRKLK